MWVSLRDRCNTDVVTPSRNVDELLNRATCRPTTPDYEGDDRHSLVQGYTPSFP